MSQRSRRTRLAGPRELAPELVRKPATGHYDSLAGRSVHDVDELLRRIDEVRQLDLHAPGLSR